MRHFEIRRRWIRWRYHLSALILLAPVLMAPTVFHEYAEMHDARVLPVRRVGPWTVTLAEHSPGPPHTAHTGRKIQDFSAVFCEGCAAQIRGAFLHAGERPTIEAPGWPLHGNPHHLEAHVVFPPVPGVADSLWLTVDAWDGSVHQIAWPLVDGALPASLTAEGL